MRPWTRLEAIHVRMMTRVSRMTYLVFAEACGPTIGNPNSVRSGASIAPEVI